MKRNIYSYSKLWMILFVLMGAACTNQVEDAIPVSGQPIEFSVQSDWKEIPNTRSNDKTHFEARDEIQIFGFHRSPSNVVQKFMYREDDPNRGQIVTFDNGSWNYSPKRFWPKEGKLEFYASYPQNSIFNNADNRTMNYVETDNSMKQDLLWGVSIKECAKGRNDPVEITMYHALAKVNISLDESLGDDIGSVIIASAYKAGRFTETGTDGIPKWIFNDGDKNGDYEKEVHAIFYKYADKDIDLIKNRSVTVFILPEKIKGLQMWNVAGDKKIADASEELKQPQYTFKAGKEYNLKISSTGVQKENPKSRSIAMSVRCVSE